MAFMCKQSSKECDACGACDPKPAFKCNHCGEYVYPGDDYWNLGEYRYCESCITGSRREAPEPVLEFEREGT